MRIKFKTKKLLKLALVSSLLLIIVAGFSGSNSSADTNTAIGNLSPTPDSGNLSGSGDFTPVTGVGRGKFDGNYSWAKVYVRDGESAKITIQQVCLDTGSPDVVYKFYTLNAQEQYAPTVPLSEQISANERVQPAGSCHNDVVFHIPSGKGVQSVVKGHDKYKVFGIVAEMKGHGEPSAERYFRINNDNGKVGLATPIDFNGDIIPRGEDYYGVYSGSGTWSYSVIFAPRCSVDSGDHPDEIKVFDADNGLYQSGMDAILERSPRNSGAIDWHQTDHFTPEDLQDVKNRSDPKWGNSGTTGDLKISVNKKYIYKFTVRDSKYPNTIQIRLPFDQLDGDRSIFDNKGCDDWNLTGTTDVNKFTVHDEDTTATFSHSIKNSASSDAATYSWKVQAKYIKKGGAVKYGYDDKTIQSSGGNITTAAGNNRPDDFQDKFKFSDENGHDGDKYCERIHYTNANGPDTGEENSDDKCVTLDIDTTPPNACRNLDVYDGGAYNNGNDHNARMEVWGDGVTVTEVNGDSKSPYNDIGDIGSNGNGKSALGNSGGSGQFAPDASGSQNDQHKTWKYIPYQPNITLTRQRQWHNDAGWHATNDGHREYYNGRDWIDYNTSTESPHSINCYAATCTVTALGKNELGNAPNKVLADQDYTVSATITNATGGQGLYLNRFYPGQNSGPLALSGTGGSHNVDDGINVGDTKSFTFTLHAPSNASLVPVTVHAGYTSPGTLNRIGPDCTVNVGVYERFTLTPTAKSQPAPGSTAETPTNVSYNGKVQNSESSVAVAAPSTSSFYKKPIAGGQLNLDSGSGGTYAPNASTFVMGSPSGAPTADGNYAVPLGSYTAGDQFCAITHLTSFSSGWVGPGGDAIGDDNPSDSPEQCFHVVNQPYVHFAGSDVSAGGGFGLSCNPNESSGSIYTYNESPGTVSAGGQGGAGAQFGAEAANIISGLGSANLRSSTPTGVSGLTFANSGFPNNGASEPNKTNGGYLGGANNFCVPDYFNSDRPATLPKDTATASVTAGTGVTQQYYQPGGTGSGTLTLNGGTIPVTPVAVNQTIFVDGDVNIAGNITYANDARTAVNQIPSFYLVVRGNIHIDPGVTQLDGVYVAQPNPSPTIPGKGTINTCLSPSDTDANHIYDNCKNQLVINGAFVANKVFLTRSYSSLRYSQNGEHSLGGYNSGTRVNCGVSGKDIAPGSLYLKDCAAEIFNFTPELYMSQPALNPRYGPSSNKYDAITSLSPVL